MDRDRFSGGDVSRLDSESDRGISTDGLVVSGPAGHLSPEPVVVGIASPVSPSPGAIESEPEHLSESVVVVHEECLLFGVGYSSGSASEAGPCEHGAAGSWPSDESPGVSGQSIPDASIFDRVEVKLQHGFAFPFGAQCDPKPSLGWSASSFVVLEFECHELIDGHQVLEGIEAMSCWQVPFPGDQHQCTSGIGHEGFEQGPGVLVE